LASPDCVIQSLAQIKRNQQEKLITKARNTENTKKKDLNFVLSCFRDENKLGYKMYYTAFSGTQRLRWLTPSPPRWRKHTRFKEGDYFSLNWFNGSGFTVQGW